MSPKLLNILLVLIPIVLYVGYIDPMYSGAAGYVWTPEQSIPQLKGLNKKYGGALDQLDFTEREIIKVTNMYRSVSDVDKNKIGVMFADSVDQVKLRNELVSMASESGIALSGLSVEEDKKIYGENYGAYIVSFSLKAKYPSIKKFIETYEKNMRFFVLDNLSMTRQDNSETAVVKIEDEDLLSASVTSRVYYLK